MSKSLATNWYFVFSFQRARQGGQIQPNYDLEVAVLIFKIYCQISNTPHPYDGKPYKEYYSI
jgi:hypothetical protein